MISVDEARNIILSHARVIGLEKIDLMSSLGRIAGEDVYASFDIPPWDNSAMDGYAVRFEDINDATPDNPVRLMVIQDLAAGYFAEKTVGSSQAIRIMTGAPIPNGADTVVMKEDTTSSTDTVTIAAAPAKGANIRRTGESVAKGSLVIRKNTLLRPPHIGMLASLGQNHVSVHQRPRVAVLSTGDEVIEIDSPRDPSKIINSNTYSISAQVLECGAVPVALGIARDDKQTLVEKLRMGLSADVIITTGGVSVGEYDYVKDALEAIGTDIKFWKVAMRPGKPVTFGVIAEKLVFGLPGNPVSCMVSFEQFVRPALLKKMGSPALFRPLLTVTIKEEIKTQKNLTYFLRVRVTCEGDRLYATTTGEQGSGILTSMVDANGLLIIPPEKNEVKAGEKMTVQILDRSFDQTVGE
ncbi:MAG: molybdopterin molybdotransferase MoeA [Deltaproteobacteria bacterium]|nr:molybdopterin molybdotransferase MoeA [Deltaproteobacteria bacterium]